MDLPRLTQLNLQFHGTNATVLESAPGSFLVVLETTDGEIATGILLPPWDGLCLALERTD